MTPKNKQSLFDIYTLKDVFGVWKRSWKIILGGTLAFSAFGTYWALSSPIQYTAEASFCEKNHARGGVTSSSLTALLLSQGSDSNDSSAVSAMKSRTMIENLIKLEGLQAVVTPENSRRSFLSLFKDNIVVEYARFMNDKFPSLPEPVNSITVKNINYDRETPLSLKIEFLNETSFFLKDGKKEIKGNLDVPVMHEEISFTLKKLNEEPLATKSFNLNFYPLSHTASDISKLITITTDKDDKSLLRIRYRHANRQTAVKFVNTLMALYQEHIDNEHKKMMSTQISYLQKRQNEVFDALQGKMQHYVDTLSEDFSSLGFIDTQRAMEFLAANQHAIKSKQLAMDMEIKRLESVQKEGRAQLESLSGMIDNPHLNRLLTEIRDMKQQYDAIQVALSMGKTTQTDNFRDAFDQNIGSLIHLKECYNDTCNLIAEIEKGKLPKSIPKSISSEEYMIGMWNEKLKSDSSKDLQQKFLTYLLNLKHHFNVFLKVIEENLAHQQKTSPEFQGINLPLANELFLTYNKEVNLLEGQILQYDFIIEQLQLPDFELSSLSAILNDPVSKEIANTASTLALAVNDKGNRTEKELVRLQDDLQLQRKFLKLHLKQARNLLKIKFDLLQNKIYEVRKATLGIIQQMISVLENQILEQVSIRISSHEQEFALLNKQQEELQRQMALLPKKWVVEQLIHQNMEMHKQMSREITSMVESKNISGNLEIIQSAPLDTAILPLHADSPRLLFLSIFGAFAGLFLTLAWTFMRAVGKGIPVSAETLKLIGAKFLGYVNEKEIENSLNRLSQLLVTKQNSPVLIVQGTQAFAEKLEKKLLNQGITAKAYEWNSSRPNSVQYAIAFTNLSAIDPEIFSRIEEFSSLVVIIKDEPLFMLESFFEQIRTYIHKPVYFMTY